MLLIEAGGDEPSLSDVPLMYSSLQLTPLDWQYKTEPNGKANLGMKDGRSNWPRGKVLGGSSVLNAMLYIRGNRRDYDAWQELGNPGWSYDDVLPYFKKSEDFRVFDQMDPTYHGTGGPLTVEEFRYSSPITDAFIEGGKEIGYEELDVNAAVQTGFTKSHGTVRDGK